VKEYREKRRGGGSWRNLNLCNIIDGLEKGGKKKLRRKEKKGEKEVSATSDVHFRIVWEEKKKKI